jgi:hypothetical protein
MAKFRKKPVVIEAMQVPPLEADPDDFNEWARSVGFADYQSDRNGSLFILQREEPGGPLAGTARITLEGMMAAEPGDWIIRGVKGEFYPCKPDIFAATYEPADTAPKE